MQLDKYQASILAFLFDKLPLGDDVDSLEFSLSGTFPGKYRAVHAAIEHSDQPARFVISLPSYSHSVFIALTRDEPQETARLLANLEDYEREAHLSLTLGELVITPDQTLHDANMPFAILLLRTATSLDCADLPDSKELDSKRTNFFLVVPLTKEEWEYRNQYGHDALLDKFQIDQKELFF